MVSNLCEQRSTKLLSALVLLLLFSPVFTARTHGWSNGGYSSDPSQPDYGTHDWIAQHALDWLPPDEKAYLENNLAAYLYGTELPDNGLASDGIGDTTKHHVYYFSDETVQDDSSAMRASEEYDLALSYLEASDFVDAAKHVGIMAHYIVDLTVFGHVMGSGTTWGTEHHHSDYESYVNTRTNSYEDDFNSYLTSPGDLTILTAYDAAMNLAYDTTFDVDGGFTCVWMDQNYDWNNSSFKDRCGESLNLAVTLLANVIHTLYLNQTTDTGARHVVINEIELNPAGNDNSLNVEEWVELYNPTESDVPLDGWMLLTTHGITITLTIPPGIVIDADGYYVCRRGASWLNDAGASVVLRDSEDVEIDRSPQLDDGGDDDLSWQRCPNGLDTNATSDWRLRRSTYASSNGGITRIRDLTTVWRNAVLVRGTSTPYGPLPWGALIEDTTGINSLLTALSGYGSPSAAFDVDVAEWVDQRFNWTESTSTALIAVGGPAVNLVSHAYNPLLPFNLTVTEEYIELRVDWDGVAYLRLHFDPKQYVLHYSNSTETHYAFEDHDFAVVSVYFDSINNKHMFFVMGMRAEGTLGACRYLASTLNSFASETANAEALFLHWNDADSNGEANGDEMTYVATYP